MALRPLVVSEVVSHALPAIARMTSWSGARPRLLLYGARYQYRQKNAVAATLAWIAEQHGMSFEVYYDAIRAGRHYGGGGTGRFGLLGGDAAEFGLLTGGLVTGGRHLEAVALALQRFQTTVICSGELAFAGTLATVADASGAVVHRMGEGDLAHLYETVFSTLKLDWPATAVMLNAAPTEELEGIDSYLWPEIFYRKALGAEVTAQPCELQRLLDHGVREVLTCGVSVEQRAALAALGFRVEDLSVMEPHEDYAVITAHAAKRWQQQRRGWLLGDPVLASYWLPTACRERRAAIYGVPQARVLNLLQEDIASRSLPEVVGRQEEDGDFFALSTLGQSFQVVDPGRPPLPILLTLSSPWPATLPGRGTGEPSDDQLLAYARDGRVLVSLVFWSGMIRETENLYALMDLLGITGLHAGIALTVQSLAWRPSPLDLLTVPREQGGVFPQAEVLLASCGTGAAIESLLTVDQLSFQLESATRELERLGVPRPWRPEGWWATMDAPMVPLSRARSAKPVRWTGSGPYYIQFRFHPDWLQTGSLTTRSRTPDPGQRARGFLPLQVDRHRWFQRMRRRIRDSPMKGFFSAYRPYENFEPGPLLPELSSAVKRAGFSYMLSKSGFGRPPRVLYRDGDFVALNYTAGRWDGWTPFETINDVDDLRRAEKRLLARRQPGWLLGTVDTCLRAFSGELWEHGPELAAIARFAASGGSSGKLINVTPRVVARYARLIDRLPQSPKSPFEASTRERASPLK